MSDARVCPEDAIFLEIYGAERNEEIYAAAIPSREGRHIFASFLRPYMPDTMPVIFQLREKSLRRKRAPLTLSFHIDDFTPPPSRRHRRAHPI